MGMEGVDLVIRLEKEFGITLDVEDLPELETVGDLYALVQARIAARNSNRCLALKVFRELRAETRQVLREPNLKLRPRDEVIDIVPWRRRRAYWRNLSKRFKTLAIWDLKRHDLAKWLSVALCLAGMVFIFVRIIDPQTPGYLAAIGTLLVCVLPFIMAFITYPLKLVPPTHLRTFGEITLSEVGRTIATKVPPENPRHVVDEILIDVLEASREEIVPTAHLVKDLGMG